MENNEQLKRELNRLSPEGRITCSQARKVAEDLGISPRIIGEACNELKIKICACELSCFR